MKDSIQRFVKSYFVDAKCKYCPRRVFYTGFDGMTEKEHEEKKVCDICHERKQLHKGIANG